jgi:hypothetical protein
MPFYCIHPHFLSRASTIFRHMCPCLLCCMHPCLLCCMHSCPFLLCASTHFFIACIHALTFCHVHSCLPTSNAIESCHMPSHHLIPTHTHVYINVKPYLSLPQITTSSPGIQAVTLNIAKFHCTCPIHPEHKPWFTFRGPDGFYTNSCCPFSCSSSSSNAGMIRNASIDIWEREGVTPIVKFEDKLNIFHFPIAGGPHPDGMFISYTYAYDHPQVLSHITSLNIPWHPDKGKDFSTSFTYLGISWDIKNKSITLYDHKHEKFLNCVNNFLTSFSGACCQMQDMIKIHSSLCHIVGQHETQSRFHQCAVYSITSDIFIQDSYHSDSYHPYLNITFFICVLLHDLHLTQ